MSLSTACKEISSTASQHVIQQPRKSCTVLMRGK